MRCSCGKIGLYELPRRALPYCEECFHAHLVATLRKEIGPSTTPLIIRTPRTDTEKQFAKAAQALATLSKREYLEKDSEEAPIAGCTETHAAATVRYLLGFTDKAEVHVPRSITYQEIQMFFKGLEDISLDNLTQELIHFDKQYPGTTASITKHVIRPSQNN